MYFFKHRPGMLVDGYSDENKSYDNIEMENLIEKQKEAVRNSLKYVINIVRGLAGSGKTQVLEELVKIFTKQKIFISCMCIYW